jgi:hypothetical protein
MPYWLAPKGNVEHRTSNVDVGRSMFFFMRLLGKNKLRSVWVNPFDHPNMSGLIKDVVLKLPQANLAARR